MTLIEALQSEKRFKRPMHTSYFIPGCCTTTFSSEDVLATDWFIKDVSDEVISVSESHFDEWFNIYGPQNKIANVGFYENAKKALGFK